MTESTLATAGRARASSRTTSTNSRRRRWGVGIATATITLGTFASISATAQASPTGAFEQVNLVSDLPGVAPLLDPQVKNPWGIAFGPDTPLWVSNNFNPALGSLCPTCPPTRADLLTKVTIYRGANGHDPFTKIPLEVTASSPTGIVFNPTHRFVIEQGGVSAPARFLFDEAKLSADGATPRADVTGWTNAKVPPLTTTTSTPARRHGAFYLGLALIPGNGAGAGPRLIAVGGQVTGAGAVDVFNGAFKRLNLPGAYMDPDSQGLSPYNVAYLGGRVYIAYSSADQSGGAVSVFTRDGTFIKRLVTGAPLVDPWGMAIAPKNWGDFGGALLVGNVDDGQINAFDRHSGALLGTLSDAQGNPLVNPGLWGIEFGNGVIGTPHTLLFAAGIGSAPGGFGEDVYAHGLVGLIEPVSGS